MSGELPVRENKFVEQWGYMRENLEHKFRWTPKTMRTVLLAGVIFPVLVYRVAVKEFVRTKETRDEWEQEQDLEGRHR